MKSRTQRKLFIVAVLIGITVAGFLTYRALQENLLYFFSPTQVAAGEAPQRNFRLGGMVARRQREARDRHPQRQLRRHR